MAKIIIVGDGPAGLSAALLLAKNGHEATVYGKDETPVHRAYLQNYLGLPDMLGDDFLDAAREQVARYGAILRDDRVTSISEDDGFRVETEDGSVDEADYLVLAEGKNAASAAALGLEQGETGIAVDTDYRSSMDRVYVVGRSARLKRSQAIISAGAGAVAALDILAREAGKDVQDWDTPPKEEAAVAS
jgi:thioredoxin reductase